MAPHQQRVVEEKADLDVKLGKLMIFNTSDVCRALPEDERKRLIAQQDAMTTYSLILEQRISAFTDPQIEALSTLNAGPFTQRTGTSA